MPERALKQAHDQFFQHRSPPSESPNARKGIETEGTPQPFRLRTSSESPNARKGIETKRSARMRTPVPAASESPNARKGIETRGPAATPPAESPSQNPRMPERALKPVLRQPLQVVGVCQNPRMPERALKRLETVISLISIWWSESPNARKGIETRNTSSARPFLVLVRIPECPKGH